MDRHAFPGKENVGLCVIIGGEADPVAPARAALDGGAGMIQYRGKEKSSALQYREACRLRTLTREYGAALIINDRPDIAQLSDADGVHLGLSDLPVSVVRRLLGKGKRIGATAHSVVEGRAAEAAGADYIGFGAVFPSGTKRDVVPVGPDRLRSFVRGSRLPVLAIGGIANENVAEVCRCGVAGVAVVSAVTEVVDPEAAARDLVRRMAESISSGRSVFGS